MDVKRIKQRAMEEVDRLREEMNEIAHQIHQDPEVGWETPRAAGRLSDFMERHGLKVDRAVAGLSSSFRAYAAHRFEARPGIAFLAEYDALPGLGHGCGHNLIGTTSAGAGIALSRVMDEFDLPGAAYVMGTPFEEGGGGKIVMINEGLFEVADAGMMFHPANEIRIGGRNIAAQGMTFRFHGVEAHSGTSPHEGVNAADAAMLTFAAVNALRQHVTSDVRIHGIITSGGDAPNTVPKYAEVKMIARALTRKTLEGVAEKVRNCARAGALATGAELEIENELMFYEMIPVPKYREVGLQNLAELGYGEAVPDVQAYHSADSGNVSYVIPHLGFTLPIDPNPKCVPHTPLFAKATDSDMAREAMNKAAKFMVCTAIDLLTQPDLLAEIKAEHERLVAQALA